MSVFLLTSGMFKAAEVLLLNGSLKFVLPPVPGEKNIIFNFLSKKEKVGRKYKNFRESINGRGLVPVETLALV